MLQVQWFGVFHPKTGELWAVEESDKQAAAIAAELAGAKKKPWPVKPVTISEGMSNATS
jgi:hypothetical protein